MSAPTNQISQDAAAALLQIAPDTLAKLAGAGLVRRAAPGKYIPAHLIRDYIAYLHKEPERRERAPTQAEISEHLDMSDRNLREVLSLLGLDHKEAPLARLRVAYIRHLREVAAGRQSDGGGRFDLVQERAGLAREQRIAQALKNKITRKEFAPIGLLSEVLATASGSVAAKLDGLPGIIKKVAPELSDQAREAVAAEIAKARNEWVADTRVLEVRADPSLLDPDDDPEEVFIEGDE